MWICSHQFHGKRRFLVFYCQWEYGSWASTRFLMTASSINMFRGPQHGLWRQYRPLDTNMDLCHNTGHGHHHSPDINMASGGSTVPGHCDFRGQYRSWTSAWPSVVTQDTDTKQPLAVVGMAYFFCILAFFIVDFPLRVFSIFISVSYTWVIIIKSLKVTSRESNKDKLLWRIRLLRNNLEKQEGAN